MGGLRTTSKLEGEQEFIQALGLACVLPWAGVVACAHRRESETWTKPFNFWSDSAKTARVTIDVSHEFFDHTSRTLAALFKTA